MPGISAYEEEFWNRHHTYHDLANPLPRNVKDSGLVFARDGRVKWVYNKLLLRSEPLVFCQRVIHATDFTHSRHENEDRGRVSRKAIIFETYAL